MPPLCAAETPFGEILTALERRSPTRRIAFLFKHAGSETGIPSPIEMTQGRIRTTIAIVLAAVTVLVYLPMLRHGFVNYDDPDYILNNPHVRAGLTWSGMAWAFQSSVASNWHPLTWISHMIDCGLFGVNPAGHHLVNVLFHTANAVLLFLLLSRLSGALWRSAFVAALFAWHPLHVESVAWASERKDVLSAFFWMLTLLAYAKYVTGDRWRVTRTAGILSRVTCHRSPSYFLALLFFACGLMSKPMVVTLPFVLLLLDFWPLRRFTIYDLRFTMLRLIGEKIPFFALTIASCIITRMVQHGALWSSNSLSFHFRMANALMSYVRYISKMFWPADLALIYPYPHYWPLAGVIAVGLLLALCSVLAILWAKRFPYLAVGWFWYLGTLVPAIGLVQAGIQSMADRYTYLPSIGLFIVVVWGFNDLLNAHPQKIKIAAAVGSFALAGCLAVTSVQLRYWRNSLTLFLHTVEVTTDNYAAYNCLGTALENIGKKDDAAKLYAESVRVEPDYPLGQFNLGMILLEQGRAEEASNHLAIAAQLAPRDPVMQFDFGMFLLQHGNPAGAAVHFKAALAAKPDLPEAKKELAKLLAEHPELN
jgi:tetratricopeptide (TPR) repeat protein